MIGFNHALVGGLIGKFLPLPVALPLALASHFVLDTLPHYGIPQQGRDIARAWKIVFTIDFLATMALIAIPIHEHNYAMLACGFIAVVPDFVWVSRYFKTKSFNMSANTSWFTKWHAGIQHYERPWGIFVELPVAALLFIALIRT